MGEWLALHGIVIGFGGCFVRPALSLLYRGVKLRLDP